MTSIECGAACLAMVLSYYGRGTRVAECAERLGVGRDGLTARAIAEGARAFGMRVRAYSLAPQELARVALPAIAHWEFNHFVVVERWTREWVHVIDPGAGRHRMSVAEFDAGFTGVTLVCQPDESFQPKALERRPWLRLLRRLGVRQPRLLAQVLAASLILQLLGLALPLLSKAVIDGVVPRHDYGVLGILAAGAAVLVVSQSILGYLRASLLVALRIRIERQLVPLLIERLLALPYRFFEQRRSGDLVSRVNSISLMRELMAGQATSTLLDGTFAIGYLTLVFTQDATMGLAVLGLVAAEATVIAWTARTSRDLARRELAADAATQSYLVEALSGIATLKASGTENRARRRWSALFAQQIAAARRKGGQEARVEAALSSLRTLAPLALLLLGASRVLGGDVTLGTMLATLTLAAGALTPFASLIASARNLQLVFAHLERLADIFLAAPEQADTGAQPVAALEGRIELRDVSFRYGPRSPLAVRGVSVDIAPGQKVAVVGRSGSGKSTLGKLLLGLYEPTAGTIRYDGVPAASLDQRSLRRQFGVVLQEPLLFSGSIRDNIAFNAPGASLARVVEAAELAGMREEIDSLAMGYETPLAEAGLGLSGGQRQRLALARALLHQPAFLLLDEATSHLDAVTEARIERELSSLGCTRIVIAHRLSTIRDADLILVMDNGRIVEQGTHDELVALGGAYAALTAQQGDRDRL
jgi:ABC-type bacteriocin/lantibiotic exporter with double-glycine peptidase domain